jgi:hypothetical protein
MGKVHNKKGTLADADLNDADDTETIIDHTQMICNFPDDSMMVHYMDQQWWTTLTDIMMITTEEVKDCAKVKDDGSFKP